MKIEELMSSFFPHAAIRGGIFQTIVGSQFPGKPAVFPELIPHTLDLGIDAKSIIFEIKAKDKGKPVILLAHGMGGCSGSGYIKRIAAKLWSQGYGVFLINHRGSGAGMGLSSTLWNGGSSEDLRMMVDYILERHLHLIAVGFSLSGNILLKYLGEGRSIPNGLLGALAVNPPIDLRVASHILSTHRSCWLFNRYYMRLIGNQVRALIKNFPDALDPRGNLSTIWNFDVNYTAPVGGYRDVDDYYDQCSGKNYLKNIETPTSILCAQDDPFVPPEVFRNQSSNVDIYQPAGGGHMGYISRQPTSHGDRRWMDYVVLEWIQKMCKRENSK